jgi:hypothetical protein
MKSHVKRELGIEMTRHRESVMERKNEGESSISRRNGDSSKGDCGRREKRDRERIWLSTHGIVDGGVT